MSERIIEIDGPRLDPAEGGPAETLVILCHGYGADGRDLISLAAAWQGLLPRTAFVAPNAPHPCDMAPQGYQWYPLGNLTPEDFETGVRGAAPTLEHFIDRELDRYGLSASKLALVGFSQGTMMSLHVGLRRLPQIAGILGYSGTLAAPDSLAGELRAKPPVILVHGDRDELIPHHESLKAAEALNALDVPAETHISSGAGHGIAQDGMELGGHFIASVLVSTP